MKQHLVGTHIGGVALRSRAIWQRLFCRPEQASTLGQDAVADLLLPHLCRPAHVFVDVGAHIGRVISSVRQADPSVTVVAIEADPIKAKQLVQRWPTVQVHSCAVGDRSQLVAFYVNIVRPGFSSLRNAYPDETIQITVPMRPLDELVSEADVVKIDVEGCESEVLRGSVQLANRCRPTIFFESGIGDSKLWDDLYGWFDANKYGIYVPNRVAHDGPPLTREGFAESHWYPVRTNNYFAIADERRDEIRGRARKILGIKPATQPASLLMQLAAGFTQAFPVEEALVLLRFAEYYA